jgi:hypothetical protein
MNEQTHDRLFAGCGIAFVVLELVGAIIGMTAGKTHSLTISSTPAQVAHAVAKPVGTTVWIGGYLEVLSVGAFLAFAVWACAKLGGGLLGATARTAATAYAAVMIASLAVMAAIAYRAGHGMGVQLATALVPLNEALYVCTLFLSAFFLVAAGALALTQMRRALGWSAIGVATLTLVGVAAAVDSVGQFTVMLWFAWIVYASIAIARGKPAPARAMAVAQSA